MDPERNRYHIFQSQSILRAVKRDVKKTPSKQVSRGMRMGENTDSVELSE
jgi:hypothetical protein